MHEQWIGVIKDLKINWELLMSTRRRKIRVKSVTYEFQDGPVVVFKKKKKLYLHSERFLKQSSRIQYKADGMLNS